MHTIAGIELGGTKIKCAVARLAEGHICHLETSGEIPTSTPAETLNQVFRFFHNKSFRALGVASFGPLNLTTGHITTTPKLPWRNFPLLDHIRSKYPSVPIILDTDVNGAALAELNWGAAQGVRNCVYLTIGTGIGGGAIVEGNLLHGLLHPEMGHLLVRKHPDDPIEGLCPSHGQCLEGLASGPAIEARTQRSGKEIVDSDPSWKIFTHYIAQALANYTLVLAPEKIILGGGVMERAHLFPPLRSEYLSMLNGYLQIPEIIHDIDKYIVPPGLGADSGLYGALALAVRTPAP